jgi:hypothetical protein
LSEREIANNASDHSDTGLSEDNGNVYRGRDNFAATLLYFA